MDTRLSPSPQQKYFFGQLHVCFNHASPVPRSPHDVFRVNTTIAGGVACVTSVALAYVRIGYVDITAANNGVLGGLVAITAG